MSNWQMHDLMKITNVIGVPKLVFLGDGKQLTAIEAASPTRCRSRRAWQLQSWTNLPTIGRTSSKAPGSMPSSGQVGTSFHVHEVGSDKIAETAAKLWARLPADQRDTTQVMAASHRLRKEIGGLIREQLVAEGKLIGDELRQPILVKPAPDPRGAAVGFSL